ncbi:MAG: calcium-binding protein [Actinomycetota bacterium]
MRSLGPRTSGFGILFALLFALSLFAAPVRAQEASPPADDADVQPPIMPDSPFRETADSELTNAKSGGCFGHTATKRGTRKDDLLKGTNGVDVIVGRRGNDIIQGLGAGDFLCGNQGKDRIFGDEGNDHINGGQSGDVMMGGPSSDDIRGSRGEDVGFGEAGFDHMQGGSEDDTLTGGPDADTLYGDSNGDTLDGSEGEDLLFGGIGIDTLSGGPGNDQMDGADGNDTFIGGEGDDSMTGGSGSNTFSGEAGNDTMFGGDGPDFMFGNDGADTEHGRAGIDCMSGGVGNDTMNGEEGADTMAGNEGVDTMRGGPAFDFIDGAGATDRCAFSVNAEEEDVFNQLDGNQDDALCINGILTNCLAAFVLTITDIVGDGSVESSTADVFGDFISCDSELEGTCSGVFADGDDVDLEAIEGDDLFDHWGDDATSCGSNPMCTITMDENKNVTATFGEAATLDVTLGGTASGTAVVNIDPPNQDCSNATPANCTETYVSGEEVTLTITNPAAPSSTSWVVPGGATEVNGCANNDLFCVIEVDSDVTVTVNVNT